ncbi:MAG: hypothetical protein JRC88_11930, partial [Deltaproteobacteria bacterium]|nr:hypothetical protein [Deltaproteobacteria bacterium]
MNDIRYAECPTPDNAILARRLKMIGKIMSVLCVLIIALMSLAPAGQSEEVKIMSTPVTKQIYMITGKGGNIGLFIGEDGTFLIDDQFAPLTE